MAQSTNTSEVIGWPLEIAVFLCGALVMIYEINGSRIIAPFLGTSTYIWTSLIGVILAALSVGYWLGGKLADSRPDVKYLASILFAAGGLVSITILTKEIVLSLISDLYIGLEFKALAGAILLFAPASIAFGFVLPFAVRLRVLSLTESGSTVGRLYALSTLGSIAGTFLAGFLLIPFVGSVRTLYLIAGSLFVISIILAPFSATLKSITAILLFLISATASEGLSFFRYRQNAYRDFDTQYARLSVFEAVEPSSGKPIRVISNDPHFLQSAMFLEDDELVFDYTKYFHLANHFSPQMKSSLMIGGAGYSFPRDFIRKYPEAILDVVEIDPKMTDIARKYFRLNDNERMNIFHQDARVVLRNTESGKYDVVIMDAFGTLFSIPYHLTTQESMKDVRRVLTDKGILIMNLGGALSGRGSGFFRAELATLRSVFSEVRIFKVKDEKQLDEMQNLIIVASNQPLSDTENTGEYQTFLANEFRGVVEMNLPILTDDLAPVEYYNSFAQNSFR